MLNLKLIPKILYIVIIFNYNVLPQDPILENLDDPDPRVRINTLYLIQNNNLTQYIPDLEERMFIQSEPYIVYEYMRTLYALETENLETYALDFIEFADNFPSMEPPDDPLRAKVYATHILFTLGNYSTADYSFEILNRDFPNVNSDAHDIMVLALKNIPQLRELAKNELLRMIDNCPDNFVRFYSVGVLKDYYENDFVNYFLDWFENDTYASIRMRCLVYLSELHYSQLNLLLKNRLSQDPDWSLRIMIADSLLSNFGEPSDLKAVTDYQPYEPNETARSLIAYSVEEFIPPKPETTDIVEMINSLITYTDESFQYQWIEEEAYNYYIERLNTLLEEFEGQNFEEACRIINEDLLLRIEQDYNDYGTLTIEGYKFLHYHTVYIKEELNNQFYPCE